MRWIIINRVHNAMNYYWKDSPVNIFLNCRLTNRNLTFGTWRLMPTYRGEMETVQFYITPWRWIRKIFSKPQLFLTTLWGVTYQKTVTVVITSNLLSGTAILTMCSRFRNNNEVDYNSRNFGIYLLLLGLNILHLQSKGCP